MNGPGLCRRSEAERERSLHGRPRQAGQHRRVPCPLIRRARSLVAVSEAPPFERAPYARHDRRDHIFDLSEAAQNEIIRRTKHTAF